MQKFLIASALLSGIAIPAIAQEISKHRAAAIERCQKEADAKFGPSGVRDWRRFNHDWYAACMADADEPE